jgi:hypothetical protein
MGIVPISIFSKKVASPYFFYYRRHLIRTKKLNSILPAGEEDFGTSIALIAGVKETKGEER